MSLDTILQIGSLYRKSPKSKDYHELINRVSKDADAIRKKKDANGKAINPVYYQIPVKFDEAETFVFLIDELQEITDEDKKKSLYYLNFKASAKDSAVKYLWGDLVYSNYYDKNEEKESGNYRLTGYNAFERCNELAASLNDTIIGKFRNAFLLHKDTIEKLLLSNSSIIIHFDFGGRNWYELDGAIDLIDENLLESFASKPNQAGNVFLTKYLYKTLKAPEKQNESLGSIPGFVFNNTHKTKLFTKDEIKNLMYAIGASKRAFLRIKNIGIVALPKGDSLSVEALNSFLERTGGEIKEEEEGEQQLTNANKSDENDDLFASLVENEFEDKVRYDILLMSIPASPAGVFTDLVEVSSIEKSLLSEISKRINEVRRKLIKQAELEFAGKVKLQLDIKFSFLKILSDKTKAEKKYQYHLLKILPQIYSDTYYQDPVLLPAFIEKVESNLRGGGQGFPTLKFDFYFLMHIQKQDNLMNITESKSYAIGRSLGVMAKQFAAWRDDCPIKSFEKSYVGNLTRRVSSLDEVAKFCEFLNEKLTMHNRLYSDVKTAYLQLIEVLKNFGSEKYNKHYCSLGFFESYYTSDPKKEKTPEKTAIESSLLN
ncbi:MAG: hypothetical protein V4714_16585 [Bacteroidota bacterium]